MIFQNSNKKPADDATVAVPNDQSVDDQNLQDDQELARVLADIDSQVNANNDSLIADLEKAVEADQSQMEAESTEAAEMSSADSPVSFEKVEQETAAEAAPVMADFQPADIPVVNEQVAETESAASDSEQAPVVDLNQQLEAMNQQISASVADMEAAPALEAPSESVTIPEAVASVNMSDMDQVASAESTVAALESESAMTPASVDMSMKVSSVSDLDELRKKALTDLRPIVDKVELNDEESFDVLLLLIRETDDESLLPRAYEAARQIQDEARRAQALLDVIKEADYFKHKA